MDSSRFTRRRWIAGTGSALALSTLHVPSWAVTTAGNDDADRASRMRWWHEAKFGMFVHWGLYSVLGRHEWVMEDEGIPVAEYEPLAKRFQPKPNAPRDWAMLARAAGQKYMVMTPSTMKGSACLIRSSPTTAHLGAVRGATWSGNTSRPRELRVCAWV